MVATITRRLVSLNDAADALAVSTRTVRRYISDGQLDAVRLGRKTLRIKVDSIERFSTLDQLGVSTGSTAGVGRRREVSTGSTTAPETRIGAATWPLLVPRIFLASDSISKIASDLRLCGGRYWVEPLTHAAAEERLGVVCSPRLDSPERTAGRGATGKAAPRCDRMAVCADQPNILR